MTARKKVKLQPYNHPELAKYAPMTLANKTRKEIVIDLLKLPEYQDFYDTELPNGKVLRLNRAISKAMKDSDVIMQSQFSSTIGNVTWTPTVCLDPWLHFSTSKLLSFLNDRGKGPSWTNIYTLQEFLVNWSERRMSFKELVARYCHERLTEGQLETFIKKHLYTGKISSPLIHFAVKLLSNEPIVKPDYFLPNPFPPDRGLIGTSYAFYKIPNFQLRDRGIPIECGDAYLCPQRFGNVILGQRLEALINKDYTEELEEYKKVTQYNPEEDGSMPESEFYNRLNLLNTDQYRYNKFVNSICFVHTFVGEEGQDRGGRSPKRSQKMLGLANVVYYPDPYMLATEDPNMPGKTVFIRNSNVRMFNMIALDDLVKRTFWDRITEHSLVMFNDSVHDRAQRIILKKGTAVDEEIEYDQNGENGRVIVKGLKSVPLDPAKYPNGMEVCGLDANTHRRDYFKTPIKIRHYLHNTPNSYTKSIGLCTPEFHKCYPDADGREGAGRNGDQLHPIFDYVLRFDLAEERPMPFTYWHCRLNKIYLKRNGVPTLYYQVEAKGAKLRFNEQQWQLLGEYMAPIQQLMDSNVC